MSAPVAVLVNPTAGKGRRRTQIAAALALLRKGDHEVRVLDARSADAAVQACREAVADGAGALIAVGGDGTVNVAIQAVAATGVPFGVLPAGTGNDFATELGIPADLSLAAGRISEALTGGRSRSIDLADLRGPGEYQRWFAAVLGAGFDAIVNERANAMRWPKGPRRYNIAIFAELMRLAPRQYRITLDGQHMERAANLVAVGNTASYGGGMRMCPVADPTDGRLDVIVAGPVSRTTLLRLQPKVYKGTHVRHKRVDTYQARTVEIDCPGITAYADGERTCPLPITVRAVPGALTLLA